MGDPASSLVGGVQYCSPKQPVCPPSYYCHVGSSPENTVCCPSLGNACLAPMSIGTGSAGLPR